MTQIHEPAYTNAAIADCNMVFEGGAMRGLFTCGVTDFFMEKMFYPKEVIGVSAGALVGFNYVAGYRGRAAYVNMKYINDPRFLGIPSFIATGNVCGRKFVFDEIPNVLEPYNYDWFNNSPTKLTVVSSNIETAKADYHTLTDFQKDLPYIIASSSLPLLSVPVEVEGKKLVDGGVCDSMPIHYSFATGAKKHIVVLTRDAAYRKKPDKLYALECMKFPNNLNFVEQEQRRPVEYNKTALEIQRLEAEGKIFVIRPQKPVEVAQLEKDEDKLLDLYAQGYEQAMLNWDKLLNYLNN